MNELLLKRFIDERIKYLKNLRGIDANLMVGEYEALKAFLGKQETNRLVPTRTERVVMVKDGKLGPHIEKD